MPRAYRGAKIKKLKSISGAKKRFRRIGSAKKGQVGFKSSSANHRHQMTCKTPKMKRQDRRGLHVRAEDLGRIEQMLPYA